MQKPSQQAEPESFYYITFGSDGKLDEEMMKKDHVLWFPQYLIYQRNMNFNKMSMPLQHQQD